MLDGPQDTSPTNMHEPPPGYDSIVGPLEERMIRSIWRIVRNVHDAEDAMQNALTTIWKRWDRVRSHESPRALVLKICVDSAYDVLRRRAGHQIEPSDLDPADPAPHPAEELAGRETYAEVIAVIRTLSRRQATAVSLRILEEFSYHEIASAMGCAEATARKHVLRARARLRIALARHEPNRISGRQS